MILIIDDDQAIRSSLTFLLKRSGLDVATAAGPSEAMGVIRETTPRLILMDMNFGIATDGTDGLRLLERMKAALPHVPVILMTAWGSIELAVKGMQAGAFDFITKPWNNLTLMQRIHIALDLNGGMADENHTGYKNDTFDRSLIIGRSKALKEVLEVIRRVAATNAPVLITGENGTGKELIAETIHRNSRRAGQAFVKVNLGGISQSLFESEMFGHRKGAFTDAVNDRTGRFELAEKGTIFLDEIGDLDPACQVKLLRVLQDQTYEVLGDSRQRKADVRVISATNADLKQMISDHTFREDLFYRINLITVRLPALRERKEDIPLLAEHFIHRQCKQYGFEPVTLKTDAIHFLMSLPYPGNIRELKNLVERTVLVCGKTELTAEDFQAQYHASPSSTQTISHTAALQGLTLEEIERQTIIQALHKYNGNLTQVAATLGISRGSLYRRLEKFRINPDNLSSVSD